MHARLNRVRVATALLLLALGCSWLLPGQAKHLEGQRQAWKTSKVIGSPDPALPFEAVRAFPNAKFNHPLVMTSCPESERLFVGEQEGKIYSFPAKQDAVPTLFCDLKKDIRTIAQTEGAKEIEALYGLVFHPKFVENRYCFICYTLRAKDPKIANLENGTRVSRFRVSATEPPRLEPESEEVILTFLQGGHNGGDLHFGHDGMLYISSGDASNPNPPDHLSTGQDCSDLLSSILRIDVDHKDAGRNYAVPKENPFIGMANVKPEIWAYGLRNPWRMSFDRQTGDLWVGDVGWELWEMVHKVEKGGNYGWSIVEGRQSIRPNQKMGPTPIRPPLIELPHTIAASITGGYIYRGKKFPELVGSYIFGDWETRRIWAARFDGERLLEMPEIVKPVARVVAFGEDRAGELYFLDYDSGSIFTFERSKDTGRNHNFPTKLSETGLFADVTKHQPAEGVESFEPIVKQWQDGATANYLLAMPGNSPAKLYPPGGKSIPGNVEWHKFRIHFPKDAVLVKTISYPGRKVGESRKIETQLLHFDGVDWHGYSYAWRDDGSEADLVPPEGAEKIFSVVDSNEPMGQREQLWVYHSRTQCMTCHNAWAEYSLAFHPMQLRKTVAGEDQLLTLNRRGVIERMTVEDRPQQIFDSRSIAAEQKLSNPHDNAAPLGDRARSYLHVNCSHCHRFGGGGSVALDLEISKPIHETGLIDKLPKQGEFGVADAKVLAPGNPNRSIMYYRMAKFGRGRMPQLGSEFPDEQGLDLIGDWIVSLGKIPLGSAKSDIARGIERNLSSPDRALPFARGFPQFTPQEREQVRSIVEPMPSGPVRDLFEGYFPVDAKGRKLGSNPRPSSILALAGDSARGEKLFLAEATRCASCHKVGDKGIALGPDLSLIGKQRTKLELLESMLDPSRRIEPKYASYNVKTVDGRSLAGLLVARNDKIVTLRTAENKEVNLAASDVETIQPARLSLMPDGLMSGLLVQEAADLLEYLATRK